MQVGDSFEVFLFLGIFRYLNEFFTQNLFFNLFKSDTICPSGPDDPIWTFNIWFRVFDIFKPGPVQIMDNMKTGAGVMLDDIVAGILALFITQSLYIFWIK